MTYVPKAIETADIQLDEKVLELCELLAKNAHENWALQRIRDGWTYGPRSEEKKQNPCLVPYEELPESEKVYDRIMATETLKTICALGYRIVQE